MGLASYSAMKILIAARLTLLSLLSIIPVSSAIAGDFSAVVNGKSYHVDATE